MSPSPRVAFLVESLGRSGGMAVIREHARSLDATLVVCHPRPGELPATDAGVPVRRLAEAEPVDVAIATWWTTAERLFEVQTRRRALYLQNLEFRFYDDRTPDQLGAFGVLDLPVDYLVIASHMQALLARLRPDARVRRVPPGIDKSVFVPGSREPGGPLRVLVEGQPTLWFKGVRESVRAVRRMREPATVTVAVHDPTEAADLEADRVVGGLDPAEMAALYAEHDVLLKLPRFEGLGLPPLEAFHVGLPCVVTPFTGGEDYIEPGVNALVAGFDDERGTAAALDRLATDAGLRARLREGALATAARWPDRKDASAAFAAAVHELLAEPPPAPDAALRRMAASRRLAVELARVRSNPQPAPPSRRRRLARALRPASTEAPEPLPVDDTVFALAERPGTGILVVGGNEPIVKDLRDRRAEVRSAPRLTVDELERAAVVVLDDAAPAFAVLAAGRLLVLRRAEPAYGLLAGVDHLAFDGDREAAAYADAAVSFPAAFAPIVAMGRLAAEVYGRLTLR
jgi:hypothetical protein